MSDKKNDKHLNVFWTYNGSPSLENNVTKALINTFESLDAESKIKFVKELFEINLCDEVEFNCYLQKAPDIDKIKSVDEDKRLLFAFSPTGKHWGQKGIDTKDCEVIKKSIEVTIKQSYPLNNEQEVMELVQKQLDETMDIINNKGGSIPDAWILISVKDKLKYCIAMENKLYDLDPYQLNNHCEKSLFMENKRIKYVKYSEIQKTLNNLRGYLISDFLKYMYYLGYFNNLSQLHDMDEEDIRRLAIERCRQLLTEVSEKEVSWHRKWMYKFETNNIYNPKVGMDYLTESCVFSVPLYFGSTQKGSKMLYEKLKKTDYRISKKFRYQISFHFQYKGTGRNISESYYSCETSEIEKYINFWIDNLDYIKQMDKTMRAGLLKKMFNEDIIPEDIYRNILSFSEGYEKALNVCPEFGVFCYWDFEKAMKLDEKGMFAKEIYNYINEVYDQFEIDFKL